MSSTPRASSVIKEVVDLVNMNHKSAGFRKEMEQDFGGPPNDPERCVSDCKVRPKGVEPPDCHCGKQCIAATSRDYETFGQRYWYCMNMFKDNRGRSYEVRSFLVIVV
jgi:hypothetical protein